MIHPADILLNLAQSYPEAAGAKEEAEDLSRVRV